VFLWRAVDLLGATRGQYDYHRKWRGYDHSFRRVREQDSKYRLAVQTNQAKHR